MLTDLLDRLLREGRDKPSPAMSALLDFWERDAGEALGSLADFERCLAEPDGDLVVLDRLSAAACHPALREQLPTDEQVGRLLVAAMLISGWHYVRRYIGAAALHEELPLLRLRDDESLAAAWLAACLHGSGLRFVIGTDGAGLVPFNVLSDVPPIEFGFRDGRACVLAEIDALLQTRTDGISLESRRQRQLASGGQVRTLPAIRVAHERFRREHGVGVSFVAPLRRFPPPLRDAALREELVRELGVTTTVFGKPVEDEDAVTQVVGNGLSDDDWAGLCTDLLTPLRAVIDALAPHAAAAVAADLGPPVVFISKSNRDEDKILVKCVVEALQVLEHSGKLKVWVDDRGIEPGVDWDPTIKAGLDRCTVGVLLVSTGFLNSSYIRDTEVPELMRRRAAGAAEVIPVLLSEAPTQHVGWLNPIQFDARRKALQSMSDHERNTHLSTLGDDVLKACDRVASRRR